MELTIVPEEPFSFRSTIFSHGWIDLAPFRYEEETNRLHYRARVNDRIFDLTFFSEQDRDIRIITGPDGNNIVSDEIEKLAQRMFRLNEDFSGLYSVCERDPNFDWIVKKSAGRMFCSQSVWEDMVKMLCTTNCTWNLTRIMCNNLVSKLGDGAFPGPDEIAGKDEKYLREEIKMGYRAPYLQILARRVITETEVLIRLAKWSEDSQGLYKELRGFKGFGHYAASNLLKLLGHYDYYGSDSSSGKKFSEKHFNNQPCTDDDIAAYYDHYEQWRGLIFWLDMTSDWYNDLIPWK